MDYNKLAELLFPHITKTPEEYEKIYPQRNLPADAKVTRLGRARPALYTSAIFTAPLSMKGSLISQAAFSFFASRTLTISAMSRGLSISSSILCAFWHQF